MYYPQWYAHDGDIRIAIVKHGVWAWIAGDESAERVSNLPGKWHPWQDEKPEPPVELAGYNKLEERLCADGDGFVHCHINDIIAVVDAWIEEEADEAKELTQ